MNTKEIKKLLPDFLQRNGIDIYGDGKRKKILCQNPFHAEKNPSAQINENGDVNVHCYSCGAVYDIIDLVQWLGFASCFKEAIKYLENTYGFAAEKKIEYDNKKPLFRGHVRNVKFVNLPIDRARHTYLISTLIQRAEKAKIKSPVFEKAWPFMSVDGLVSCVDFRVVDADNRKHVITAWFDGRYVRIVNPPNVIWGLDHIDYDKPVLIVEGCKCAEIAHEKIGHIFCVHTWNRGSNAAKYADWEPLYEYNNVYLLADRDRKVDKFGNEPEIQIGMKTMSAIGDLLLENNENVGIVIRESHECVEEIKKDGGDIVEMFELMTVDDVVSYILYGATQEALGR